MRSISGLIRGQQLDGLHQMRFGRSLDPQFWIDTSGGGYLGRINQLYTLAGPWL